MTRFILVFTTLLVALFTLELLEPVQAAFVQPFTGALAELSAAIITPFDDSVISQGRVLRHLENNFAVSIEAGCNGVEATIVLIAAVLAFPASWARRAIAIVLGFVAIQTLNIARIISLFYLGQWNIDVFTWSHLYLWPALIMLDVLIVFLVYLRYLSRSTAAPTA